MTSSASSADQGRRWGLRASRTSHGARRYAERCLWTNRCSRQPRVGSFHRPMTVSQARRTPVRGGGACNRGSAPQDCKSSGGRRAAQRLSIHNIADGHKGRFATGPSASTTICLARKVRTLLPACLARPATSLIRIGAGACGRNSCVLAHRMNRKPSRVKQAALVARRAVVLCTGRDRGWAGGEIPLRPSRPHRIAAVPAQSRRRTASAPPRTIRPAAPIARA